MPKRRRNVNSTNPLSDARRGVVNNTSASSHSSGDKRLPQLQVEKKTNDLWHRKSGAGYSLFLQYYGGQPRGVVVATCDRGDASDGVTSDTATSSLNGTKKTVQADGGGMSRAAKKRQKKRARTLPMEAAVNDANYSTTNSSANDVQVNDTHEIDSSTMTTGEGSTSTHPLVLAFKSQTTKHGHLSSFVHTLATPLPLTLRIRKKNQSSSCSNNNDLETILKKYSNHIAPVSYDTSKQIYQSIAKTHNNGQVLSKSNLGTIPDLKKTIVNASTNGTIARQEIGSMLPVLCLHSIGAITIGSKVLDMCASPGSKTLQAIEIIGQDDGKKKGRIIANDVHIGRLNSLKEAVSRSGVPDLVTNRITYTNYDASTFPPPKSGKLFNAIICDVPCSGDGTIRKDKHILPLWTPRTGNELHILQVKILIRALELVNVGGVVCFSTCSLNPVEDEAVVAAALLKTMKSTERVKFELQEWPENLLLGFVHRPGIMEWKVGFYNHDNTEDDEESDDFGSIAFCDDEEEAKQCGHADAVATLWPPKHGDIEKLHLNRCVRLLPQDNDTGGFFLGLIKRLK
eukprot:scaffold5874_cov29-Cyclotella_meneghiniana.AAC.2